METKAATRAFRITSDEAVTLLDAMDGLNQPLGSWESHNALRARLRDLIIWMDEGEHLRSLSN